MCLRAWPFLPTLLDGLIKAITSSHKAGSTYGITLIFTPQGYNCPGSAGAGKADQHPRLSREFFFPQKQQSRVMLSAKPCSVTQEIHARVHCRDGSGTVGLGHRARGGRTQGRQTRGSHPTRQFLILLPELPGLNEQPVIWMR